jgi:hypothetical protein
MSDMFEDAKKESVDQDWEKIKAEMMQFISIAMSLANRIENLERTVAYLALKDPEFVKELEQSGMKLSGDDDTDTE